jgi:citronellol/citronellal dehydrogenase
MSLQAKTVFITGSTRGIGRSIALRCAKDGANVVITGKTSEPHPKLEGTIHTVAAEVEAAGGKALAIQLDVRDGDAIANAVQQVVEQFGGIDVLVNNASAISLTPTAQTKLSRFDLMFQVNVRATFACSQACLPYLLKSENAHILNIAPPLNMDAKWFKNHVAYTYTKYGMSACTLGMAEEFKAQGVAVNSLWPATTIATAAVKYNFPPEIYLSSRKPDIMSDAAYAVITQDAKTISGNFYTDEAVLREQGVDDFTHYMIDSSKQPIPDFYL